VEKKYLFINTAVGIELYLNTNGKHYIHRDNARETSAVLLQLVDDILKDAKISLGDLDCLGVCIGPGSFTGIRIGICTAKSFGLCTDLPIVPINTLRLNAYNVSGTVLSVVDGANGVLYIAKYDGDICLLEPTCIYAKDIKKYSVNVDTIVCDTKTTADKLDYKFIPLSQQRIQTAMYKQNLTTNCYTLEPLYIRKAQPDRTAQDI